MAKVFLDEIYLNNKVIMQMVRDDGYVLSNERQAPLPYDYEKKVFDIEGPDIGDEKKNDTVVIFVDIVIGLVWTEKEGTTVEDIKYKTEEDRKRALIERCKTTQN